MIYAVGFDLVFLKTSCAEILYSHSYCSHGEAFPEDVLHRHGNEEDSSEPKRFHNHSLPRIANAPGELRVPELVNEDGTHWPRV